MKISESTKRKINNFIIFCFLFFVFTIILMIALPSYVSGPKGRKSADLLYRIHSVQIAIEDHKKAKGEYPESIEELINSDFLELPLPINPFSKKKESIREIQLGEPASIGDFSYIPFKTDETIDKFTLIGYGSIGDVLDLDQDGQGDNILIIGEENNSVAFEEHHFSRLRRMKQYQEWFCEK